jgi:thioesterase domain-containing protein
MGNIDKVDELNRRLSALSPAKRALLERTLLKSAGDRPIGKLKPAVIQLQEGSGKLPVYFIYAGPDEIRFSQLMGGERPIFGVEVPWPLSWREAATNNEIAALPTLEQFVAPFVDALSAHLGPSPCVLAGHSFGGVMAFEAAHQLQRQGTEVKMVILFDSLAGFFTLHKLARRKLRDAWRGTSNGLTVDRSLQSISSRLSNLWLTSWWLAKKEPKALLRPTYKWLQSVFNPAKQLREVSAHFDEGGMPIHWSLLNRVYTEVAKPYRLRSLNSNGILFVAQPEDERRIAALYPSLGWENLFTKGLEIIPVPGDHVTMIRQRSNSLFLGQKLREVLKQYEAN